MLLNLLAEIRTLQPAKYIVDIVHTHTHSLESNIVQRKADETVC